MCRDEKLHDLFAPDVGPRGDPQCETNPVANAELAEDSGQMRLDRSFCDAQLASDLLVASLCAAFLLPQTSLAHFAEGLQKVFAAELPGTR